jgi:hypothetical protein
VSRTKPPIHPDAIATAVVRVHVPRVDMRVSIASTNNVCACTDLRRCVKSPLLTYLTKLKHTVCYYWQEGGGRVYKRQRGAQGGGRGEKRGPIALPLEAREKVFDNSSLFHTHREKETE